MKSLVISLPVLQLVNEKITELDERTVETPKLKDKGKNIKILVHSIIMGQCPKV